MKVYSFSSFLAFFTVARQKNKPMGPNLAHNLTIMADVCHTLAPVIGERTRLLITSEDTEVGKVFVWCVRGQGLAVWYSCQTSWVLSSSSPVHACQWAHELKLNPIEGKPSQSPQRSSAPGWVVEDRAGARANNPSPTSTRIIWRELRWKFTDN